MTGLLQGGLLVMAICFEIRDRRDQRKSRILKGAAIGQGEDNGGAARGVTLQNNDENTALLGNER